MRPSESRIEIIPYMKLADPVLERLEAAGYRAYLVGGCVREALRQGAEIGSMTDAISGCAGDSAGAEIGPVTDVDVATDARPEEVADVFSEWTVIETGIRHGTVTVLVPCEEELRKDNPGSEGEPRTSSSQQEEPGEDVSAGRNSASRLPVEVTTFRSDGEYSDGRHPDRVRFVASIEEDLARRDFTINAMAVDRRGDIVDPFGGRDDLERSLIRAVGDPEERFKEDGLRILRALRFASVLGFSLEEETGKALRLHKELLQGISAERIFVELKKLLIGHGAGRVLREYADVIEVVIPELTDMKGFDQHNPYHSYDVLEHCIRALETVETTDENQEYMKLAALLHDVGKPSTFSRDEEGIGHFYGHPGAGERICRDIMNRLRSDRYTKDKVCTLIKYHDLQFEKNDRLLKRWLRKFGPEMLLEILALKRADNIATGNASDELIEKFDDIRDRIQHLIEEEACFRREDLAIDGRDLIDQGMDEGPKVGMILDWLLDGVIDGRIENDRRALLAEARRLGASK